MVIVFNCDFGMVSMLLIVLNKVEIFLSCCGVIKWFLVSVVIFVFINVVVFGIVCIIGVLVGSLDLKYVIVMFVIMVMNICLVLLFLVVVVVFVRFVIIGLMLVGLIVMMMNVVFFIVLVVDVINIE